MTSWDDKWGNELLKITNAFYINIFKRKLNVQLKELEKEREVRVVVDIDPINFY